jgi:hypothetical protein
MEEEARKLDLRPLLVVAAVVGVVLTMWAAGAFAAGGSSSPSDSTDSAPSFIQNEEDPQPRTREDCPEGRGGGRGGPGGAPEGNSDGSGSPSL